MSEYKYPDKLMGYITEQEVEGAEIFITSSEDSTIFIVKPYGLDDWFVIAEWCEGSDDFSLVNLSGKALKRLIKEAQ